MIVYHSAYFSFLLLFRLLSLSLSQSHSLTLFSFLSCRSGRSRTADSGIPAGFRLSARAVLLRLVVGPVTNHDSSARERRGHTTLGSGSGACCHPLRDPLCFSVDRLAATPDAVGKPSSRAIIALCNKEHSAQLRRARLLLPLPYLRGRTLHSVLLLYKFFLSFLLFDIKRSLDVYISNYVSIARAQYNGKLKLELTTIKELYAKK